MALKDDLKKRKKEDLQQSQANIVTTAQKADNDVSKSTYTRGTSSSAKNANTYAGRKTDKTQKKPDVFSRTTATGVSTSPRQQTVVPSAQTAYKPQTQEKVPKIANMSRYISPSVSQTFTAATGTPFESTVGGLADYTIGRAKDKQLMYNPNGTYQKDLDLSKLSGRLFAQGLEGFSTPEERKQNGGQSYRQYLQNVFSIPDDATDEVWQAADAAFQEAQTTRNGDLNYAIASFKVRQGDFSPLRDSSWTDEQLGELGRLRNRNAQVQAAGIAASTNAYDDGVHAAKDDPTRYTIDGESARYAISQVKAGDTSLIPYVMEVSALVGSDVLAMDDEMLSNVLDSMNADSGKNAYVISALNKPMQTVQDIYSTQNVYGKDDLEHDLEIVQMSSQHRSGEDNLMYDPYTVSMAKARIAAYVDDDELMQPDKQILNWDGTVREYQYSDEWVRQIMQRYDDDSSIADNWTSGLYLGSDGKLISSESNPNDKAAVDQFDYEIGTSSQDQWQSIAEKYLAEAGATSIPRREDYSSDYDWREAVVSQIESSGTTYEQLDALDANTMRDYIGSIAPNWEQYSGNKVFTEKYSAYQQAEESAQELRNNPDWETSSQYIAHEDAHNRSTYGSEMGAWDTFKTEDEPYAGLYEAVNRQQAINPQDGRISTGEFSVFTNSSMVLNDEDKATFNYLYAQNPSDPQDALQFLRDIEWGTGYTNQQDFLYGEDGEGGVAGFAKKAWGVPAFIASRGLHQMSNLAGMANAARFITDPGYRQYASQYDDIYRFGEAASVIDSTQAQAVAEFEKPAMDRVRDFLPGFNGIFGHGILETALSAAQSGTDSAAGAAMFGELYTAIMGAGAFNETTQQKLAELPQGDTLGVEQYRDSIFNWVKEWASEKVTLELMFGKLAQNVNPVANTMMAGFFEGSEEVAGELATALKESLDGTYDQRKAELEAYGYSSSDADKMLMADWIANAGYEAVCAAISVVPSVGGRHAASYIANKRTGSNFITNGGDTSGLMSIGSAQGVFNRDNFTARELRTIEGQLEYIRSVDQRTQSSQESTVEEEATNEDNKPAPMKPIKGEDVRVQEETEPEAPDNAFDTEWSENREEAQLPQEIVEEYGQKDSPIESPEEIDTSEEPEYDETRYSQKDDSQKDDSQNKPSPLKPVRGEDVRTRQDTSEQTDTQQEPQAPKLSNALLGKILRVTIESLDSQSAEILKENFAQTVLDTRLANVSDRMRSAVVQLITDPAGANEGDWQIVSQSNEARQLISEFTSLSSVQQSEADNLRSQATELYEKSLKPKQYSAIKDERDRRNAEIEKQKEEARVAREAEAETEARRYSPDAQYTDRIESPAQQEIASLQNNEEATDTVNSDGVKVDIVSIASIENGKPVYNVRRADGTVYQTDAPALRLGGSGYVTAQLGAYASNMFANVDNANIFMAAYSEGTDISAYARAFNAVMQYASDGRSLAATKASEHTSALTTKQMRIAYDLGRKQRNERVKETTGYRSSVKPGKVTFRDGAVAKTAHQKATARAMQQLARALGINVEFFETKEDPNSPGRLENKNGAWDASTMTLRLDLNAGANSVADVNAGKQAIMYTAGHELTHYIRQYVGGDMWSQYVDFVISKANAYGDDSVASEAGLNARINMLMATRSDVKTRDDAIEEIVADLSAGMIEHIDNEHMQELIGLNPSLGRKILFKLRQIAANLRYLITKAFEGTSSQNAWNNVLMKNVEEYERAAQKWSDLLVAATQARWEQQVKIVQTVDVQAVREALNEAQSKAEAIETVEHEAEAVAQEVAPVVATEDQVEEIVEQAEQVIAGVLNSDEEESKRKEREAAQERYVAAQRRANAHQEVLERKERLKSARSASIKRGTDAEQLINRVLFREKVIKPRQAEVQAIREYLGDAVHVDTPHIDSRTLANMKGSKTKLFCEATHDDIIRLAYAQAAAVLSEDTARMTRGGEDRTVWEVDSGYGANTWRGASTKMEVSKLINEARGWMSWKQITDSLDAFKNVFDENGDVSYPKSTAANRYMEVILDRMLTEGYASMESKWGMKDISPSLIYVQQKAAYDGSSQNGLDFNPQDSLSWKDFDVYGQQVFEELQSYNEGTEEDIQTIPWDEEEDGEIPAKFSLALQEAQEIEDTDGEKFSLKTWDEDVDTYRAMLRDAGVPAAEVVELINMVNRVADRIRDNRRVLDFGLDIDSDNRSFVPVKQNSDKLYKVSVDFSTLCRKRLLQQAVQEALENKLDRAVTAAERIAIRDKLMELQKQGMKIEVACALCYVESARLKAPAQVQRFLDDPGKIVHDYLASNSDSIKGKIKDTEERTKVRLGYAPDTSLKAMKSADAKKVREAKKAVISEYKLTPAQEAIVERARKLTAYQYTAAESLWELKRTEPEIFNAYTSHVRNATKSKGIESDTPWKAGDSSSISDTLIAAMNAENGLRAQSWSDFQVYHMLDYISAIIELSTRKAKMQTYTKVPGFIKLMGNTGAMINMSLIPTAKYSGSLEYDSVEGMPYETALRLRREYPSTAGTICIGVNDEQIRQLLADDTIDMVIPYHHSGMSKANRKKMHIPTWTSYESIQNEKKLRDNVGEAPNFSEWFDYATVSERARQVGGNIAMQEAADRYLDLCRERGLAPKFEKFSNEANYWKLLIDRKMIDTNTGEIIMQQAVQPRFNEQDIIDIMNEEVEHFNDTNRDFEQALRQTVDNWGDTSKRVRENKKLQQQAEAFENSIAIQTIVNSVEDEKYSRRTIPEDFGMGLSTKESIEVRRCLGEIKSGKESQFQKSSIGEFIFEIGNKLVYNNGNFEDPTIYGVTTINLGDETDIAYARDIIYGAERLGGSYVKARLILEDVFGPGIVTGYNFRVQQTNARQTRRGKGTNGRVLYQGNRTEVSDKGEVKHSERDYDTITSELETAQQELSDIQNIPEYKEARMTAINAASKEERNKAMPKVRELAEKYGVRRIKARIDALVAERQQAMVQQALEQQAEESHAAAENADQSTLDAAARKWGAIESKDGSLYFYHGTRAQFTAFDRNKIGSSGAGSYLGYGFNFASDQSMASSYGDNMMRVYLKASNLLSPEKRTITRAKLKRVLMSMDDTSSYDSIMESPVWDYADRVPLSRDSVAARTQMYDLAMNKLVNAVFENNSTDADIYAEISSMPSSNSDAVIEAFKKLGYDGVRHLGSDGQTRAVIVFDANQVKSADPVTYDDEGNVIPLSERFNPENEDIRYSERDYGIEDNPYNVGTDDGVKYSARETDPDTLRMLNNQPYITTYRAMQLIDGKLYPPMAAEVDGKMEDPSELGKWEKAVEHPEKVQKKKYDEKTGRWVGSFKLEKGKLDSGKKDSLTAAYNPYMHSSNVVFNDQFTGAYQRSNLVTVECRVPTSEMDGTYWAEYAKDPTGWHEWKSGIVAGELAAMKPEFQRNVFLSRWLMPVRIMSNEEVAQRYKEHIEGTDLVIPENVVSPGLYKALQEAGVPTISRAEYEYRGDQRTYWSRYDDVDRSEKGYARAEKALEKARASGDEAKVAKAQKAFDKAADFKETAPSALSDYVSEYNEKYGDLPTERTYEESRVRVGDTRFSERDYEPTSASDRQILAQSFDSMAATIKDKQLVANYKEKLKQIQKKQSQLMETQRKIGELKAQRTKAARAEAAGLEESAKILQKQITRMDASLLKLERAQPFQEIIKYERRTATEKAKAATKKASESKYAKQLEKMTTKQLEEKKSLQRAVERQRERAEMWRDRVDEARYEARQHEKQAIAKIRETSARHEEMQKVMEHAMTLHEWITNPTNKAYVPTYLQAPIGDFIDAITWDSKRSLNGGEPTKADQKMVDALDLLRRKLLDVRTNNLDADTQAYKESKGFIDLPAYFTEEFDTMIGAIKNVLRNQDTIARGMVTLEEGTQVYTPLARMTSDQLKQLQQSIRIIESSVRKINRLHQNATFQTARDAAMSTVEELDSMKAKATENSVAEYFIRNLNWKNITPYYVFNRFGEGGKSIFRELQDGWDKLAYNTKMVVDYAKDAYTTQQVKEWEKQIHEITLSDGHKLRMTTAQIMSLYGLNRRDQGRGHLLGGGIKVAPFKEKHHSVTQADNYTLTEEDIDSILGKLTQEQIEVAGKLITFMNEQCSAWGNEVSQARFGYDAYTEKRYFPIETDSNNRAAVDEQAQKSSLFRLLNMGFTKPLVKNANNALVLRSIFDVYTQHATDMAKYNALSMPILDMIKWINYNSKDAELDEDGNDTGRFTTRGTQKSMERAYGSNARSYVTSLLRDLNAEKDGGRDDSLANGFFSRAKAAAVGANLRVFFVQISSLPRAAYVLNPKYIAGAMTHLKNLNPVNAVKGTEAQEKVGILLWKDMGFYSSDIGTNVQALVKHNSSTLEKIRNIATAPAGYGDTWTTNILYDAVKLEMRDKHPDMQEGSEAYDKAVNDRVREVIYKTQVVDSTMTRSQLMRSHGLVAQLVTFMSEPTVTYNMLHDALAEIVMYKRKGDNLGKAIRSNGSKFTRALTTFAVTSAFAATLEALFTAFRDDDEYETFLQKYRDAWVTNMRDDVNVLSMIPYVKDVYSILSGNDASSMVSQWITDARSLYEYYDKYTQGARGYTEYGIVYHALKLGSSASSVPVSNAVRDGVGLWNTFVVDKVGLPRIQTFADRVDKAAAAYYDASMDGNEALSQYILERAAINGYSFEDIQKKLSQYAKEDFLDGSITEEQAQSVLVDLAGSDEDKAEDKVVQWEYERETGLKWSARKEDYIDGLVDADTVISALVSTGKTQDAAEATVGGWTYTKETGFDWDDRKSDYVNGKIDSSTMRGYLMQYAGKSASEADDQLDKWDYAKAYGLEDERYTKYWKMYYSLESGRVSDAKAYIDQYISGGTKLSSLKSSVSSRYKTEYQRTGNQQIIENALSLFELLGVNRTTEWKKYIQYW